MTNVIFEFLLPEFEYFSVRIGEKSTLYSFILILYCGNYHRIHFVCIDYAYSSYDHEEDLSCVLLCCQSESLLLQRL